MYIIKPKSITSSPTTYSNTHTFGLLKIIYIKKKMNDKKNVKTNLAGFCLF